MDSAFTSTLLDVILLGVIFIFIYNMIRIFNEVRGAKPHLTEDEIDDFVRGRLETSSNAYTRFISHLATCEECQEKLNNTQSEL